MLCLWTCRTVGPGTHHTEATVRFSSNSSEVKWNLKKQQLTTNKQTKIKKNSIMHWVYYLLFFLGYWFISLWVSCVWAAIHSRIRTNKPSKEETQIQLASWSSTLQVGHQHAHSLYWFPLSKCQAFSGCIYISSCILDFCSAVSWKNFHLVLVTTVKFALDIKLFELPWIKNSYSLKWRWLVVEI